MGVVPAIQRRQPGQEVGRLGEGLAEVELVPGVGYGVNAAMLMAALAVAGYLAWKRQPWRLAGQRLWAT